MPRNEFSRPWRVATLGASPARLSIEADADERAALARRFELLGLEDLRADLEIRRREGDVVEVSGRIRAHASQACVVTLDPVPAAIDAPFVARFSEAAEPELGDVDLDPEADDPPEQIEGGAIDLGETVAQEFAVMLDPYPRAPGAEVPEQPDERENPFAVLAGRLGRDERG